MAADVAAYSHMERYGGREAENMASPFSYSSHPKPLYYDSYKNLADNAKPLTANIMYDKRVIRGNTWALRRMAAETLTKTSSEERKQMQERRRQIRQRLQSKLARRAAENRKTDSSTSLSVTPAISTSGRKGKTLTPPARSPRRTKSPLATGRNSSVMIEEEPIADEKLEAWSSGDSGIAVNDASSFRSVITDEPEKEHIDQINTDHPIDADIPVNESGPSPEFDENQYTLHPLPRPEIDEHELRELKEMQARTDSSVNQDDQSINLDSDGQEIDEANKAMIENEDMLDHAIRDQNQEGNIQKGVDNIQGDADIEQSLIANEDGLKVIDQSADMIMDKMNNENSRTGKVSLRKVEKASLEHQVEVGQIMADNILNADRLGLDDQIMVNSTDHNVDGAVIQGAIADHNRLNSKIPIRTLEKDSKALIGALLQKSVGRIELLNFSLKIQDPFRYDELEQYFSSPTSTADDEIAINRADLQLESHIQEAESAFEHADQNHDPNLYRDLIRDSVDETWIFNPIISSAAQSEVAELLEISIKRLTNLHETNIDYVPQSIDQLSDQQPEGEKTLNVHKPIIAKKSIELTYPLYYGSDNDLEYFLVDYCRYVIDQLIEVAAQNVDSLDMLKLDEKVHADPFEFVVQSVVGSSLNDAVDDLANEDELMRSVWIIEPWHPNNGQDVTNDWDKQLKEMEALVEKYQHQIQDAGEEVVPVLTVEKLMANANLDLVSNDPSKADMLNTQEFEAIRQELLALRTELVKERQEKNQLMTDYQIIMEERNRYICRSIAQEYLSSIFHGCMDHMADMISNNSASDGGQNKLYAQNMEPIFMQENLVTFEDVTNPNMSMPGSRDGVDMKNIEEIFQDITNDFEPWMYGRAYANVAREMTNLWLRDATGGRSQYCRCSAQRPLRRLLGEIENLQHH